MRWSRSAGTVALGIATWLLAGSAVVVAASPSPSAAVGDPRSPGQGPGLVGDPLLAIVVVAVIGLAALGATLAYVRATGGRGAPG